MSKNAMSFKSGKNAQTIKVVCSGASFQSDKNIAQTTFNRDILEIFQYKKQLEKAPNIRKMARF